MAGGGKNHRASAPRPTRTLSLVPSSRKELRKLVVLFLTKTADFKLLPFKRQPSCSDWGTKTRCAFIKRTGITDTSGHFGMRDKREPTFQMALVLK